MLVLLDTNIVIEHLQKGILADTPKEVAFAVSVITEAELLQLAGLPDVEESIIDDFLQLTRTLVIDSSIARRAAHLSRTRKTGLPDLLIAATALEWRALLATRNKKDFNGIPGLEFYDF
ncbi:type II toxin-antitoxin system VapC family toxin [Candidatus Uhrbacteria bacterium]|nr:type II toxin-antitoxin system VapC family toxin [Candidatus Uhrbacteria bacterium]